MFSSPLTPASSTVLHQEFNTLPRTRGSASPRALANGPHLPARATVGTIALATALLAGAALAQPTITGLPGVGPSSKPYAVSTGGRSVVGVTVVDADGIGERSWRWTSDATGGVTEDLGILREPGGPFAYSMRAYSLSADGLVVAGTSLVSVPGQSASGRAFRWTHETGMQRLGWGDAMGVSGDGSIVVGSSEQLPFGACRWTSDGAAQAFGSQSTRPVACNFDGSVVTANVFNGVTGNTHAHRWSPQTGWLDTGMLPGVDAGDQIATAISADGTTIVGHASSPTAYYHAFRWTQSQGMQDLGMLPGGIGYAVSAGVSANGQVVVGAAAYPGFFAVFIWTPQLGMVDLHNYLALQGVDVSHFYPTEAYGISPDGTAVVVWGGGTDIAGNYYSAWLVRGLSLGCPADFDGDGTVDFFDYDAFVVAFEAGTPAADFDRDGSVDFFDYDAFVVAFEVGC